MSPLLSERANTPPPPSFDEQEVNGRQLRVNYSNNSVLADYPADMGGGVGGPMANPDVARAVTSVTESMSIHEVLG